MVGVVATVAIRDMVGLRGSRERRVEARMEGVLTTAAPTIAPSA
jgi:hypothetical protein